MRKSPLKRPRASRRRFPVCNIERSGYRDTDHLRRKGQRQDKRLLDLTNDALKVEHGIIVFIDDDKRYMYDLRHEIRFVDASAYPAARKCTPEAFLAFLSGMLAVNYDISLISVDAFLKLVRIEESAQLTPFFQALEKLSEEHGCNFLLSVSMDTEKLPEEVRKFAG